ncbi:MAG: DMT family transporter [Candidatus Pacebacteria bacterium]|jgi:drug/metabolite transporter (DMT)-like permease|nr:DMT family transporter [Candidatus Paceibacterota bacterium]
MLQILSYIFYFIAASASPLQRRWLATRKNLENKGQIYFAFQVTLVLVVLSLFLPLFQPLYFHGNAFQLIGLTLLCGVFGAGYFMSSYTAQKHVEAGVTTLVSNIYTPITIILATFFLNEKLTAIQIFGTALLLVGILFVSKKHRIGRFKFDKYFMLMILSGVMLGVALTAERALQKMTGFSAGTMLSWWSQCAFLGLAVLITKSRSLYSKKDIAITGGLRFLQSLSWVILIFIVGNLSLVSAITTFKVVIIFVAAAIFLKEREDMPRKILGSIIALVGLLLMK